MSDDLIARLLDAPADGLGTENLCLEAADRIAAQNHDMHILRFGGVIEVMIRNPNVNSFVKDAEKRIADLEADRGAARILAALEAPE